ncbi:Charged multivesicular body protein 6 [Aphelenchoides besseyi]|nr:Charged multivesicular body protein 6 [Aphelenchoides besseyi]KAI6209290.1 Charged multivesicular body protein 6 [Aphelenchoides besseyi]
MGQLFAKPKPKSRLTEQDRALMSLKIERDNLQKAYKRHEQEIERHREMAKELLHKDRKDRALLLLKRKKFGEAMMKRIDNNLQQVYTMIANIETAVMNKELFETLQEGNKALTTLNNAFSLEDIEKIMEDTAEAAEYQQEIANILTGQLTDAEQEDVEEEFENLVHAELPEVPQDELEAIKSSARIPTKQKERVALAAS